MKSYLNKFFDGVYLINLPLDKDKLKKANRELTDFGVTYKRINAIYGKHFAIDKEDKKALVLADYQYKAIGCRESHVLAYKNAIKNGEKLVVHFEDDLKFNDEMHNIKTYIDELPDDWEFIWFGYYIHLVRASKNINESIQISDHLYSATRWHSTHFFAYNLNSPKVNKIWEEIASKYNYNHIDDKLCKLIKKHKAKVILTYPNMALQSGEINKEAKIDLKKSGTIIN